MEYDKRVQSAGPHVSEDLCVARGSMVGSVYGIILVGGLKWRTRRNQNGKSKKSKADAGSLWA